MYLYDDDLCIGENADLIRDGSDKGVEVNMLNYLVTTGTLAVCVDATTWSTYVAGESME